MSKETKLVKASLAAALVTSAIVPVASAQTPATTTEVSYVIVEQNGQLVKISMGDYETLLGAGKLPTVKHIVLNNAETFTLEQFDEVLGGLLDLNATLGHLAEKSEPVTPSGVVDGKVDSANGEIVPNETPSTPELEVKAVEPGITLQLVAGKKPNLPKTIDALVTDANDNTYVKVVPVEWDQESVNQITTEEGDSGEIKGTVTFQGKTTSLVYAYEVVANEKEAKKLEALQKMENIENYDLMSVDTAASAASDKASEASDEASNLSEESTTAERDAAQKLVDAAKELITKVEKDLQEVKTAFAAAKAEAVSNGATADDFYSEELDTSSVEDYIAEAKGYIADAEAYIKGEELPVRVTDAVAINDKTIKVTFSDGHVQEYTLEKALVEGKNKVTVEHDGKKHEVEVTYTAPVAGIASVSVINKTKLQVVLSKAVDAVSSENFTIAGASVTAAVLGEDKKTVTLTVSGLEYGKEYSVAAANISVDGVATNFGSGKVTIPAVTEAYNLEITAADSEVTADGADNTVVTFTLLDKMTGKVADADDMVLEIGSTFGNLANTRVTLQNGVGKVVLTSEYSVKDVVARISAQIIETSVDFAELKGKVTGETTLKFVPVKVADADEIVLVKAESNQADRVVLYFDKEVSPATFAKVNKKDGLFETATKDSVLCQVPTDGYNIEIQQAGHKKPIVGFKSVAGNSKAIEVILADNKDEFGNYNYLTDNAEVVVKTRFGTKEDTNKFTLTDPRQAEVTSVVAEGLKTLKVKFSEAVKEGTFTIDGLLEGNDEFEVEIGKFDPETGLDERDTATLTLKTYEKTHVDYKDENETRAGSQRYFKPGKHSLTVTQLKDFAGMTDKANISSTQTLDFTVQEDVSVPTVKATVESPEQIRLSVDKDTETDKSTVEAAVKAGLKVKDSKGNDITDSATWVTELKNAIYVTKYENEYVVELAADWKTGSNKILPANDSYTNYTFTIDLAENTIESDVNGKKNAKTTLDLSYVGSPLTKFDNVSPVISTINSYADVSKTVKKPGVPTENLFVITMDEPVKLKGREFDSEESAGNTVNATVEFQGKDKDGKDVVIEGVINSYADKNGADKQFFVTAATYNGKMLQEAVNAGELKESFTVVVKSISDDVGNTAATLTKAFTIAKEEATDVFEIVTPENNRAEGVIAYDYANTTADSIEITFTSGVVNNGGDSDLTKASNWTLNGKALTDVASIKVKDTNKGVDGYETVIITFANSNVLKADSNVITVNKNVVSAAGVKLTGEYEVVAKTYTYNSNGVLTATGKATTSNEVKKFIDSLQPGTLAKLDLTGATENITIETPEKLTLTVTGNLGNKNLVVDAANSHVNYSGKNAKKVTINNVAVSTFTIEAGAKADSYEFNDIDGGRLVNDSNEAVPVAIGVNAKVTLGGKFGFVTVAGDAALTLDDKKSTTVEELDVTVPNANVTIAGKGDIANVTTADGATITNQSGNVTIEGVGGSDSPTDTPQQDPVAKAVTKITNSLKDSKILELTTTDVAGVDSVPTADVATADVATADVSSVVQAEIEKFVKDLGVTIKASKTSGLNYRVKISTAVVGISSREIDVTVDLK